MLTYAFTVGDDHEVVVAFEFDPEWAMTRDYEGHDAMANAYEVVSSESPDHTEDQLLEIANTQHAADMIERGYDLMGAC